MLIVDIPDMSSSDSPYFPHFLSDKYFRGSRLCNVRERFASSSVGTHEAFFAALFTLDRLIR